MTTINETSITNCAECEQPFDRDYEGRYSPITEAEYCDACVTGNDQYASTAYHIDADGDVTRYYVTDWFVYSEHGEDDCQDMVSRHWVGGGWRGYYESRPAGDWTEVSSGWTTGDWGDAISGGKQAFNAWTDSVLKGETPLPCEMWICHDTTSNVFSTAVGVWIPADADADALDIPQY